MTEVTESYVESVHVRRGGWCHVCGGSGEAGIVHEDDPPLSGVIDWAQVIANTRAMGNHIAADHLEGKGLPLTLGAIVCDVSNYISRLAYGRLDEIGDGQGCETAAARSREAGRLQVAQEDLWDAFRLPRPERDDTYTDGNTSTNLERSCRSAAVSPSSPPPPS